ncbi:hypothetical protein ABZ307_21150 [Streptomyces griseorubiginosus]|uniref:hypothetical protein n=1 Tax=Streptomyces griseorubiginosus TaxID=67304 RepID=UPI0033B7351F
MQIELVLMIPGKTAYADARGRLYVWAQALHWDDHDHMRRAPRAILQMPDGIRPVALGAAEDLY